MIYEVVEDHDEEHQEYQQTTIAWLWSMSDIGPGKYIASELALNNAQPIMAW